LKALADVVAGFLRRADSGQRKAPRFKYQVPSTLLPMSQHDQIADFVDTLTRYDGIPPFSDAKLPLDPASKRVVVIAEKDGVVAIAASASHVQSDGSVHRELETATRPVMRFAAFEGAVIDAAMPLLDGADPYSIWSSRSSLDAALGDRGFVKSRTVEFLVVDLPLVDAAATSADHPIRTFVPGDTDGLIRVNRSAFDGHREAAALDMEAFDRYQREPWFDAEGVFIADNDGVAGFCWTKVHPNGDGEIFRIAVDPIHQGTGMGISLLSAGFSYLASRSDVRRGVLWVDTANTTAARLYRSLGMTRERANTEFVPG